MRAIKKAAMKKKDETSDDEKTVGRLFNPLGYL